MDEKTLEELFDELIHTANCEVWINPGSNSLAYFVTILNEDGLEVASEEDESLYTAVLRCWRALCG